MILENKFERYRGNERADKRVEELLEAHEMAILSGKKGKEESKILVLPEFVPCQKRLSETEIAFVISPQTEAATASSHRKKSIP
mgnify:CR=1 FL=1